MMRKAGIAFSCLALFGANDVCPLIVEAWSSTGPTIKRQPSSRQVMWSKTSQCAAVVAASLFVNIATMSPAWAVTDNDGALDFSNIRIPGSSRTTSSLSSSGLVAPTADRPQIVLPPPQTTKQNKAAITDPKSPILEGMVYLSRPNMVDAETGEPRRPMSSDTLVVLARGYSSSSNSNQQNSEKALAGAAIPVSRFNSKFPMQFRLFRANIAKGSEQTWDEMFDADDIFVTATICHDYDRTTQSCRPDETNPMKAQGISKRITNLPGMQEGVAYRNSASLALQ